MTDREEYGKNRPGVDVEAYEEGDDMIVEDGEGNVLSTFDLNDRPPEDKASMIEEERRRLAHDESGEHAKHKHEAHAKTEGEEIEKAVGDAAGHPYQNLKKQLGNWRGWGKQKDGVEGEESSHTKSKPPERKRGPAHAYQFGHTIIVEDEDGEVIKTYTLPGQNKQGKTPGEPQAGWRKMSNAAEVRRGLGRMGTWVGVGGDKAHGQSTATTDSSAATAGGQGDSTAPQNGSVDRHEESADFFADDSLRFTISHIDRHGHGLSGTSGTSQANGITTGSGRRYSAVDFLKELQQMEPKAQIKAINASNAPDHVKTEMRRVAVQDSRENSQTRGQQGSAKRTNATSSNSGAPASRPGSTARSASDAEISLSPLSSRSGRPDARRAETDIFRPMVSYSRGNGEDVFQRPYAPRRTATASTLEEGEEEEEEEEIPTHNVHSSLARARQSGGSTTAADNRRQRLATIVSGGSKEDEEDGSGAAPEGEEKETAAEKRRRMAALGVSQEREGSESEDEGNAPSAPQHANVAGAGVVGTNEDGDPVLDRQQQRQQMRPRETLTPEPKPRIQWGGVSGREAVAVAQKKKADGEREEAARSEDAAGSGSGSASAIGKKGIKGLFAARKL